MKKHTTDYSKFDSLMQQQKEEEDEEEELPPSCGRELLLSTFSAGRKRPE